MEWMKMPTKFGQLLRTYRHQYKARIGDLCDAIGCSKTELMDAEFGRINPPNKEWISKWADFVFKGCTYQFQQDMIQEMLIAAQKSTVEPPAEWIDIRERQPEVGQVVLFVTPENSIQSGVFDKRFDDKWGKFVSVGGTFCFYGSHWLPLDVLPQLPTAESEAKS